MKYNRHIFYYYLLALVLTFSACTQDDSAFDNIATPSIHNNIEESDVTFGDNILKNGGLEKWEVLPNNSYDYITDWIPHNNGNVKMNWKTVNEGNRSAKMKSLKSGSTARVDQCIPVTPGNRIRIRFKYYVERWQTNGARTTGQGDRHLSHTNSKGILSGTFSVFGY